MSTYVRLEDVKEAFHENIIVANREVAEEVVRVLRAIKNNIEKLQTFDFDEDHIKGPREDCLTRPEIYYREGLQDGRRDMAKLLFSGLRDMASELAELRAEVNE